MTLNMYTVNGFRPCDVQEEEYRKYVIGYYRDIVFQSKHFSKKFDDPEVKKAFELLYDIGDMALNVFDTSDSTST